VREHPGARAVAWALDPSLPVDEVDQIQALVEGAMLGGYDAGRWKSCGPPRGVDRFIVWGAREELREAAREPRSSHGGRTSHESSSTPRRTWPPPLLERFAGEEPWAPVDMIGPALLDDDRGDAVGRGASGYGVSMLIELASRLSDPQAERS
jgi:leucyl aminopeptidase